MLFSYASNAPERDDKLANVRIRKSTAKPTHCANVDRQIRVRSQGKCFLCAFQKDLFVQGKYTQLIVLVGIANRMYTFAPLFRDECDGGGDERTPVTPGGRQAYAPRRPEHQSNVVRAHDKSRARRELFCKAFKTAHALCSKGHTQKFT